MKVPTWLTPVAKEYWKQYGKVIAITDTNRDTLAILCQCLADYRDAVKSTDTRQQKIKLDFILKYSRALGLYDKPKVQPDDSADPFLDNLGGA